MYTIPQGGSVQDAWSHLQALARKIRATRSNFKDALTQEEIFQQLLEALPSDYNQIRDAIDGQKDGDVEQNLSKLLEKELQIKNTAASQEAILAQDKRIR